MCALLALALAPRAADAAIALPSGFQQTTAFAGLTQPTAVQFASDGRVFVAEKSGLIKVFDSLTDTTPTTFADLRTNTHNFWDRGLLGLVLHPNFRPPRTSTSSTRSTPRSVRRRRAGARSAARRIAIRILRVTPSMAAWSRGASRA